jgi:ATP-dependent protease HslVU (ClpYQ) peptidase subunit
VSVVAYKDGVIAADRRGTMGNTVIQSTKVGRLRDGKAAAWAGELGVAKRMLAVIEGGKVGDTFEPVPSTDKDAGTSFVLIAYRESCHVKVGFYENATMVWHPVEQPFFALGCGRDFALGYMAAGGSARDAVLAIASFDCYCGDGVDVLEAD